MARGWVCGFVACIGVGGFVAWVGVAVWWVGEWVGGEVVRSIKERECGHT